MNRTLRTRPIVALATVGVAVLVYSLLVLFQRSEFQSEENERLKQADIIAYQRLTKAEEEALRQNGIAVALQEQIEELGERPVVIPDAVDTVRGGPTIVYQRPSREQIVDSINAALPGALRAICASACQGPAGDRGADGSPGPAGPAGPAGADGRDGRGIAALSCTSLTPLSITVAYSDGETATVACTVPEEE